MLDIGRREFITLLGGAVAWPFAARAQQSPVHPLIGILSPISATGARPLIAAFRSVLRDLGYLEGQNVTIAIRYGEGAPERMVPLSREMVALNPDVIVAGAFVAILFPPGLARLCAIPAATGSSGVNATIGIVCVAL